MLMSVRKIVLSFALVFLGALAAGAATNTVEIFYLPHPPAEAVVREVEGVLKKHSTFTVAKYNFEDPQSKKLLEKYNVHEHMPVVLFINGQSEFTLGSRKVVFKNFPKGNAFVPMFEGNWSYKDLDSVLSEVGKAK